MQKCQKYKDNINLALSLFQWWLFGTSLFFFYSCTRGWGHSYFRLDIILVKGLSKRTRNIYFSGMKIDPKYLFLHAFFCNLCVMSFPKFVNMTKNIPFFPQFYTHKQYTHVHCLVLKNNPNYVNFFFFFYRDDIQFEIQVPPRAALRWIPQPKTFTSDFTQWPQKKMVRSCYSLIACKANYLWCLELFWTLSVFYMPYCS